MVALASGVAVAVVLAIVSGDKAGASGVILGSVSAAVIGGIASFAVTSFFECAARAWADAVSADSPRRDKQP
ncbi:MAG: hypothetical protein R3C10_24495 [Pirellulales bacterium]